MACPRKSGRTWISIIVADRSESNQLDRGRRTHIRPLLLCLFSQALHDLAPGRHAPLYNFVIIFPQGTNINIYIFLALGVRGGKIGVTDFFLHSILNSHTFFFFFFRFFAYYLFIDFL